MHMNKLMIQVCPQNCDGPWCAKPSSDTSGQSSTHIPRHRIISDETPYLTTQLHGQCGHTECSTVLHAHQMCCKVSRACGPITACLLIYQDPSSRQNRHTLKCVVTAWSTPTVSPLYSSSSSSIPVCHTQFAQHLHPVSADIENHDR